MKAQSLVPKQSRWEELFNSISHGITALVAIAGLVVLIVYGAISKQTWSLFSAILYGLSLMFLYTASAVYHGISHPGKKEVFRIIDHASIYILIAGTYTPVFLLSVGGVTGWVFFGLQWGLALAGITLKIFFTGKFEIISVLMYLAMGWMALFQIQPLYHILPLSAFWLLFSGGVTYTVGVLFYVLEDKFLLAHFIWHLFVMAGSLLHFLMVLLYII